MGDIKVLVIDDSAIVRQTLSKMINETQGMEVVDIAHDTFAALKKLETINPEVITLDVEGSGVDGLAFLEKQMKQNPIPVVMCSTLTREPSEISVNAFHLGVIEIIEKPVTEAGKIIPGQEAFITNAILTASKARLGKLNLSPVKKAPGTDVRERLAVDAVPTKNEVAKVAPSSQLIAIGASTGGTQALEKVISELRSDTPGIVIVQHMPAAFTGAFAQRLNSVAEVTVKEAEDGEMVEIGKVLIAPGGKHMIVDNRAGKLYVSIKEGPPVGRHLPSVDVLFRSVAQSASKQSLGIIMTGMGDDGAIGMKEMFDNGAFTVAQDEDSCVIFGMPAVAIDRGGVKKICSLEGISRLINAFNRPAEFDRLI